MMRIMNIIRGTFSPVRVFPVSYTHLISPEEAKKIIFDRYLAGVDWGWEHWGAIVLIGVKGRLSLIHI